MEGRMEDEMNELVGVRDAVAILGVSVDWLAGKRYRGLPPAWRKIGSAVLYWRSDLFALKTEWERTKLLKQTPKEIV